MNRFEYDDKMQRKIRDEILCPRLYEKYSMNGRYVCIDKGRMATLLQKRYSVDVVCQSQKNHGEAVFIEEKIVRFNKKPYTSFTLEIKSCTIKGRESDGWMVYGEADILNYVMCQSADSFLLPYYLIPFQKLKKEFWKEDINKFADTFTDQINRTLCKIVPIKWIREKVGFYNGLIELNNKENKLIENFNLSHYKLFKKGIS